MKLIFAGLVLAVFAVIFSLAITKKETVSHKTGIAVVKFNLKGLPEHGISLIAPSDASFNNDTPGTFDPYSVVLKNTTSRSVVGYSFKWECADAPTETASRDMSNDRLVSHLIGFAFLYGDESDRKAILNRAEDVIRPNTMWLISFDSPARQITGGAEDVSAKLDQAAVAKAQAACPTITVIADGIFFDDGTFIGPDTNNFFTQVKTQIDTRYEVLQGVQNDLKSGKSSNEVFQRLEQIRHEEQPPIGGDMTLNDLHSYYRNVFAQDILGKKNLWGPEKAIEEVHQLLSKPWVKLRKL